MARHNPKYFESAHVVAERFNPRGRKIEDVSFTVQRQPGLSEATDNVYIHLGFPKRSQGFVMSYRAWCELVFSTELPQVAKSAYGAEGYAACREHLHEAMNAMVERRVRIVNVAGRKDYTCHCGEPANWFLKTRM